MTNMALKIPSNDKTLAHENHKTKQIIQKQFTRNTNEPSLLSAMLEWIENNGTNAKADISIDIWRYLSAKF